MKNFNKKTAIIVFISFICILCFVFICSALNIKFNNNIYNNVYILNNDISGYNSSEIEILLNEINNQMSDNNVNITQNNEDVYTINISDIDMQIEVNKTITNAFSYGRTSNEFINTLTIIKNVNNNINVNVEYTYNEDKLEEIIKNIDLMLADRYVETTYTIDDITSTLTIKKGLEGNAINYEDVSENIINSLIANENIYELDTYIKELNTLDIDIMYEEVNSEAEDAYIDEVNKVVVPEVNGYSITKEDLSKAIEDIEYLESYEEIVLNLNVDTANVKYEDLNYSSFNDKLSGFTTYFNSTEINRSTNIQIGTSYINSVIVEPGEVFSFNDTIGEITESKGYLDATIFQRRNTCSRYWWWHLSSLFYFV